MRHALLATAMAILPASGQAAVARAEQKTEKPVCRAIYETGSRMPKGKECHTAAEWSEIDAQRAQAAKRQVDGMQAPGATLGR
jgi:hypothetical protein